MKKRFWSFYLILLLLPSLAAAQVPGHYSTLSVDGNGSVGGDLGIAGNVTIGGVSRNTWPSANPSPLTTKGDILTRDGSADTRLPVGSFHQILVPDSSTASGLRWSDELIQTASDVFILATNAQEAHGIDKLNMTQGYSADMQTSSNHIDPAASSGFTYDGTNKLYRNTQGGTGLNSDVNYSTESNFVQQEWTNTNQGTSQATFTNASATATISSGTWPTNAAGGRISSDGGATWYNILTRDSGTQLTLDANYTGTTGAYSYKLRMSVFSGSVIKLNGVSGSETADVSITGVMNSTTSIGYGAGNTDRAQTFQAGITGLLTKVDVKLQKTGTLTGNVEVSIVATAGGTPIQGSVLSSVESIANSSLTGSPALYTFTFASPAAVTSGTTYAIFFHSTYTPDTINYPILSTYNTNPYANGKIWSFDAGAWDGGTYASYDASFITYVNPASTVTSEYVSVTQLQSTIADSSAWSQINSFARAETLNSQSVYYWLSFSPAASYGAGTTINVWNTTGAVWRPITQNSSGTWQYNNDAGNTASTTWVNSTVNDMLFAVSQAISAQAGNRMTGSQMVAMTSGQIQGTGGWTTSVQKGMVGVTLYSASSTQNPTVTQVRTNYNAQNSAMDLRTKTFSVSSAPTSIYLFTIDKQLSGTPTYYITCDGGTTWVSETMSAIVTLTDGRTVRRWTGPTTCTGTDMRARVTVPVGGNYEISAIGEQSR